MTTSADVPARLPCAIDGHAYLMEADYERTTVDVIRQQSDASSEPGEQSLSPYGLWRRSQESWHHGAGQEFLDGKDEKAADPHRFRASKGMDVWTRGQISLLHPTLKTYSTANTNLYLAVGQDTAGTFALYIADGNELYQAALPYNGLNTIALQNGTGWTATNATISATSSYFRLTATAADIVSAISPTGTSGVPVQASREYGIVFQSIYVSGGAARTPTVAVRWYTAAGATISTTTPVVYAFGDDGTPFTGATVLARETAPATAAFAAVIIAYTAASAIGEIHDVRAVGIGPYDNVTSFGAPDTWNTTAIQAGEAAQPIQSITTNGSYVWAALGISGIHRNQVPNPTSTANVPAAPGAGQIHLVGYANGFLLAAGSITSTTGKNTLWNVTGPISAPALSLIKTHENPNFAWTGIAPGRNVVYAFGNSGGNGEIYKVTYDQNTGTLSSAASFASYLPDGETIHSLQFYAGGIILGTGKGVRLGQADAAGNIDYGPLIPTLWPVRCLEPQDRYCWFGWTKYDATNSGLGRVDLGYFTDTLTPAWASDLMTPEATTGDVVACVTFAPYGYTANQRPPVRVFTVASQGLYIEDPGSRVPAGELDSGSIRYSTSEPKHSRSLDVLYHISFASTGFLMPDLRVNDGAYVALTPVGSITGGTQHSTADATGEMFEVRLRLGRATNVSTGLFTSLDVTRWTLKSLPTPTTIDETFTLTLLMKAQIETNEGEAIPLDVPTEVAYIKALEQARTIVEFQVANTVYTGYVVKTQFKGEHWVSPAREYAEGKLTVVLQTVRG